MVGGIYSGGQRNLYNGNYSFASSHFYPSAEYFADQYGIPVGTLLKSKETEQVYEQTDTLTETTEFYYDNSAYIAPSRIIHTNSKGNKITTTLKYPYDFSGIYADMVAANRIGKPVEVIKTNTSKGVEISRKKTNFDNISAGYGFIAPVSVQQSRNGGDLINATTFDVYDQYGNVLQKTNRDGIPVSYLWGYGGLYPVAELAGVKYAEVPVSYLNNAQVFDPSGDAALRTLLSGLRASFSGLKMINTYTYKRLVGMTSKVDPNGQVSFYRYDPIGRLIVSKDNNQNITGTYEYKMIGPTVSSLNPWYVNLPMMETHYTTCPDGPLVYNYIVPGGKYSADNKSSANNSARNDLEGEYSSPILPPCPDTSNAVAIELLGFFDPVANHTAAIPVDFIQDGAVVASQTIPLFSLDDQDWESKIKVVYLKAGTYTVSFRPPADIHYSTAILGFSLATGINNYTTLHSGDTVTFYKNGDYRIDADILQ